MAFLTLLSLTSLAQISPPPLPPPTAIVRQRAVVQEQEVRTLPGQLDSIPVFNSNSPEVVYGPGILLSTFPGRGTAFPPAHLDLPLEGRFDIFAHHIARGRRREDWLPIYHGLLVHNPGNRPVTLYVLQGASYVTNPDAPFVDLPPLVENPRGQVFSGPGSRLATDILRGLSNVPLPATLTLRPGEARLLFNWPIRLGNARSTLVRVRSSGPVHLASLTHPAIATGSQSHEPPTQADFERVLVRGSLAYPRDRRPTPLGYRGEDVIYGRVAGVARGSQWRAELLDSPDAEHLSIPEPGNAFAYPISTLDVGTLGTGQVQSAPMLVRYPDTAYRAHGNYGIHYYLTLPLHNPSDRRQTVTIALQTPLKHDEQHQRVAFLEPPDNRIFFRGTVRVRFSDDRGILRERLLHLHQRRGERGEPLAVLDLAPSESRTVKVDFLYPPDATPPQILTVQTAGTVQAER
ncbi:MAG: DUF3370 domain-containing protein [Spirulinaceae cyanobacterium RM2_2_10]|nr:DUF3370 domain-containing protein [Spirulinaceae cyanobacterium SM2_1_0]NJO20922.1 DUF3370 domain-containing protein [Spirulinaceae cyanobacterium RM2_2_10]